MRAAPAPIGRAPWGRSPPRLCPACPSERIFRPASGSRFARPIRRSGCRYARPGFAGGASRLDKRKIFRYFDKSRRVGGIEEIFSPIPRKSLDFAPILHMKRRYFVYFTGLSPNLRNRGRNIVNGRDLGVLPRLEPCRQPAAASLLRPLGACHRQVLLRLHRQSFRAYHVVSSALTSVGPSAAETQAGRSAARSSPRR